MAAAAGLLALSPSWVGGHLSLYSLSCPRTPSVDHTAFEFTKIHLCQPLECWNEGLAPPCPTAIPAFSSSCPTVFFYVQHIRLSMHYLPFCSERWATLRESDPVPVRVALPHWCAIAYRVLRSCVTFKICVIKAFLCSLKASSSFLLAVVTVLVHAVTKILEWWWNCIVMVILHGYSSLTLSVSLKILCWSCFRDFCCPLDRVFEWLRPAEVNQSGTYGSWGKVPAQVSTPPSNCYCRFCPFFFLDTKVPCPRWSVPM